MSQETPKYTVVKFNLDPHEEEHKQTIEFLDTLGRGYRAKWLVACARNFFGQHPTEVRKLIDATEEIIIKRKPIALDLAKGNSKIVSNATDSTVVNTSVPKNDEIKATKNSKYSGLVK